MCMNNDYYNNIDFFPSSDLNNLSFYLFCPSITDEQRSIVTNKILRNKGVSNFLYIYNHIIFTYSLVDI